MLVGGESAGLGASEGGTVKFSLSRKLSRKLHSKRLPSMKVQLRSDAGAALDSARRR